MKIITLTTLFLFLIKSIIAQTVDSTKSRNQIYIWASGGIGVSFINKGNSVKMGIDLRCKKHLFSADANGRFNLSAGLFGPSKSSENYSLMYGRCGDFKRILTSISSGISLVKVSNGTETDKFTLGLPIKAQILCAYKYIGLGLNLYANFNDRDFYSSIGFLVCFGKIN